MYPTEFEWKPAHFDRLCGTAAIREAITAGKPLTDLKTTWATECEAFRRIRRQYLLYLE